MRYIAFLFCIVAAVYANDRQNETIEVTAPVGKIRGSFMETRLGRRIYSFRGLRYAEAPVGPRRFKQAVPVAPWSGVFDATEEGPSCPQPVGRLQSEDCLRLNVYTTKLPADCKDGIPTRRPVIVYFHPGAFYVFTGQSYAVGPQYLLDQDIVLVTVNNRLGTLGMISTGDALAPGNLALKDQVEALRWVKKNIAAFGGDPNCVTISGYSSGAWSVALHILSPMSKGLFHRAISMSGSPIYQIPLPNHQRHLAVKQAELVGCPTDSMSKIVECLSKKDAIEMASTLPQFFEWHGDPVLLWQPVVEPEVPGVERFLTGQPSELMRQGKLQHVPFITGVTRLEFGGVVVTLIEEARKGNTSTFEDLNENWDRIAPISFYLPRNTPQTKGITDELRRFYFKGRPISIETVTDLAHIYSDALVGFHGNNIAKFMALASNQPVYYYEFAYQGRYGNAVFKDTKKPYGVAHHDDLMYLFYGLFPWFDANAPEIPTVERMTAMWANFAKTGQPIPCDNPRFANVTWTPFTLQNNKYLEINDELVMKTNLNRERMAEWERLFPQQAVTVSPRN